MELPQNYNDLDGFERRSIRKEYIKLQYGKCYHCGENLDKNPCSSVRCLKVDGNLFPIGFFNYPIHLHHDHDTGMTIGAVHSYCNAVLWQYHGK